MEDQEIANRRKGGNSGMSQIKKAVGSMGKVSWSQMRLPLPPSRVGSAQPQYFPQNAQLDRPTFTVFKSYPLEPCGADGMIPCSEKYFAMERVPKEKKSQENILSPITRLKTPLPTSEHHGAAGCTLETSLSTSDPAFNVEAYLRDLLRNIYMFCDCARMNPRHYLLIYQFRHKLLKIAEIVIAIPSGKDISMMEESLRLQLLVESVMHVTETALCEAIDRSIAKVDSYMVRVVRSIYKEKDNEKQ